VILSDDAGQFNILLHALCWVHAQRTIHKLIPSSDAQRDIVARCRGQRWDLYADLKTYRESPCEEKKIELSQRFDEIFTLTFQKKMREKALVAVDKGETEFFLN